LSSDFCSICFEIQCFAFSALTLLVGWQERHPACENWGAGVVVGLEQGADLHTSQLMPLPLTVSCFSKIQIGFTFLVPAHLGSPEQRVVKRMCVCCFEPSFPPVLGTYRHFRLGLLCHIVIRPVQHNVYKRRQKHKIQKHISVIRVSL